MWLLKVGFTQEWSQSSKLVPGDPAEMAHFGAAVASVELYPAEADTPGEYARQVTSCPNYVASF